MYHRGEGFTHRIEQHAIAGKINLDLSKHKEDIFSVFTDNQSKVKGAKISLKDIKKTLNRTFSSNKSIIQKVTKQYDNTFIIAKELEQHKSLTMHEKNERLEDIDKLINNPQEKQKLNKEVEKLIKDMDWISKEIEDLKKCMRLLTDYYASNNNGKGNRTTEYNDAGQATIGINKRYVLLSNFEKKVYEIESLAKEYYYVTNKLFAMKEELTKNKTEKLINH